jgi:S-adenosylmethionine-dependent methyltransferase
MGRRFESCRAHQFFQSITPLAQRFSPADLSLLILSVYARVLTCDSNWATSPEWRMKVMTANDDFERFQTGAAKYAAYLETPEGRLRLDLAFANLQDFLPPSTRSLRALDLGCGIGAIAVRLARLGLHVTLLDASVPMLDFAMRAAREAAVSERIAVKHGDAAEFASLFRAQSFDLILCHNILEYVDDPCAVLRSAARALRDPSSIISVLVRNQAGEVLKAAIQDGDLAATEQNLTAEWGHESLYGGRVRLFTAKSLLAILLESSLAITAERGVRVLSDYLPQKVSRKDEYQGILELERTLGRRPEFAAVARYTHCLAHRTGPVVKDVT